MNVQFKGVMNPMLALQQKKAAQQKPAGQQAKIQNQPEKDLFVKKDPKFGASCCG